MTKEELSKNIEDCIITLKLKEKELKTNKVFFTKWNNKLNNIKIEFEKLNKEDILFVDIRIKSLIEKLR